MQYCKTSPDKVRSQTPSAEYDSSLVSEKNLLAIPFFLKPSRINYSLILLEFGLAQPQLVLSNEGDIYCNSDYSSPQSVQTFVVVFSVM